MDYRVQAYTDFFIRINRGNKPNEHNFISPGRKNKEKDLS